jgi:hypothetical protein
MENTKISLGFVIAIAALVIVVIGCLIAAVFAYVGREYGLGWTAIGIAVVWAMVTAVFLFPYKMEYHEWRLTEGKVATAHSRMLSGDNGPDEQFVVKFMDNRLRRCDDSRCASLKPGDYVRLWCIREWQWASEPGWRCRWGASA